MSTTERDLQARPKRPSPDGGGSVRQLEETREAWDAVAEGYDRWVTPTGGWALPEEALRRAGVGPRMRFLDVASGSGALSLPAARLGARVTAVDLSPSMVEALEARARAEGHQGLETRVMDGHALDLPDGTFDVTGSQFGVMLFPDLPRGLAEMARVTRSGGRVLVVAYRTPSEVEFLTFFLAALQAVVPGFTGPPMDPPPLPFQVADPAALQLRMEEAGLQDVRVEGSEERLEFGSGDQMWNWVVNSNPIARALVSDLSVEQGREVVAVLDGMLRERAGLEGPAVLTAGVNIGIGTK